MPMDGIRIIGAGPAGLCAAIVLRRHGLPVTVYEKAPDVGYRFSGDFQGLESWSTEADVTGVLREMGVEVNFLCRPYRSAIVHARGLAPVDVRSEEPMFYLVRRGSLPGTLDSGLKEQALALGADIRFGHHAVPGEGRTIVGTGPGGAAMTATGITFETTMADTAVVVLNDDIVPGGYAYLLVSGGLGTMAAFLLRHRRRGGDPLGRVVDYFAARVDGDIANGRRFGGVGYFFLANSRVQNGGRLYVGESGGFQDGLWGFGLRYSMVSGCLAARSLVEGSDYDALWKKELGPMQETSLVNRYLFDRFGHAGYRYLARRLGGRDPRSFLRRLYQPSRFKNLLLPLVRKNGFHQYGDLRNGRHPDRA